MRRHSAQYAAVLVSDRWRLVRSEAIRRAGYRCIACGRGERLDVHHAHGYKHLGRERPNELQALCRDCHDATHQRAHTRRVRRRWVGMVILGMGIFELVRELVHEIWR